jgi:hypothetical protein
MSALRRYLIDPRTPNTAAGFAGDHFIVVDLKRSGPGFSPASSAVTRLPDGLVVPSFEDPNIEDTAELAEIIRVTAEAAGLANKKNWSLAFPDRAARTLVINLEGKPAGRSELDEMIAWKIERFIALPRSELRVSRQRLSPVAGQDRYLVIAARHQVLDQYEAVFRSLGWGVGLILPRHLGEAQWLMRDASSGDKLLVSGNRDGFTSLVVRNGEPVLIRSFDCEAEATCDELHRFVLYYRDRVGGGSGLARMLVLGDVDSAEARRAVADAIEAEPRLMDPSEFGFNLSGEPIRFDQMAGAAGLATIAWA